MNKSILIFLIGATLYPLMEISWRGHSHYTMAFAGGVCLILIDKICCQKMVGYFIIYKCLIGSVIITTIELIIGIICNQILFMRIWDYSHLPLNVMGQISLPFSALWFFITIPAMFICNKVNSHNKKLMENKKS